MSVTSAALQAQLGTKKTDPQILMELPPYGASLQYWSIMGGPSVAGRTRNISTTAASSAATQAAAVLTALRA